MSVKYVVILLLILLPTFLIGQNGHFSFGIKIMGFALETQINTMESD